MTIDEQQQELLLEVLNDADGPISAKTAVERTGMSPEEVSRATKTLLKAEKIRFINAKKSLIELVPVISELTPEFEGQRVEIRYSHKSSVYTGEAMYIRYDAMGNVTHVRSATDLEVQWWMLYQLLRELAAQRDVRPTPDSI